MTTRVEARDRAYARAVAAQQLEAVKTSLPARTAWLDNFPPEWRGEMARRADAAYGPVGVPR